MSPLFKSLLAASVLAVVSPVNAQETFTTTIAASSTTVAASTTTVAVPQPTDGVIRQVVSAEEVGQGLRISAGLVEALSQNAVGQLNAVDYAPMFQQSTENVTEWGKFALDGIAMDNSKDILNTFVTVKSASSKRSRLPSDLPLYVRQAGQASPEIKSALERNITDTMNQAENRHGTVCAGKGARCAICFISTSMIYVAASTGCAFVAAGAELASAGTLTPAAGAALAACLTGTTGTMLGKITECGN